MLVLLEFVYWPECIIAQTQTKRAMESSTPYVILGVLYSYLLYLSWTPDKLGLIFASKYLLPEVCIQFMLYSVVFILAVYHWPAASLMLYLQLPGIGKMFANEMAVASAWIHLLAVDLFAARSEIFCSSNLLCPFCAASTVHLNLKFCSISTLNKVNDASSPIFLCLKCIG